MAALDSLATVESFNIVDPVEVYSLPSMVASQFATPLQSFGQSMTTIQSTVAAPSGGGDAPVAAAPMPGIGAAAARTALLAAAMASLPGAGAQMSGIDEIAAGPANIIPWAMFLALVCYLVSVPLIFMAGWWCRGDMSKKERLATLRPALPEEPSLPRRTFPPALFRALATGWHPADLCPLLNDGVEVAGRPCPGCAAQQPRQHAPPRVWLDDLGGCWHSDYYCRSLDGSMVIMERPPCQVCTGIISRGASPPVAATPRG